MERKPDYAEAHYYLGIALAQAGDANEAVQAFTAALRRRPQSAEIHYNFGIALWQMGKASQAIPEFRSAVELNPEDGLAHCALGKALLGVGENLYGERELHRAHELGALPDYVKRGVLMAAGADFYTVGRQMGEVALRMLQGEDPANIPVIYSLPKKYAVNLTALKGLKDRWQIPPELLAKSAMVIR